MPALLTGRAAGDTLTGPGQLARGALFALLPCLTLLGACAGPPQPSAASAVVAGLVGVWCNSSDAGATCWAYDEFRSDGSFTACGRTDDDPRPFIGEGRYTVEGARMCYLVTRASANFWLRPGARYCTDIVAMSPTAHRYRDLDTGAEFELARVAASSRRCDATP